MKAVCALVCLALAQGISAAIFKRSQQPLDEVIVPLGYINQYQQKLYQPAQETNEDLTQEYTGEQKKDQQSTSQESFLQKGKARISNDKIMTLRSGKIWTRPLFTAVMKVENELKEVAPFAKNIVWSSDLVHIPVEPVIELTVEEKQEIQKIFDEAQQAMKHPTDEEKVQFHNTLTTAAEKHNEDDHLNATELLLKNQYPVEEHTVITDDGYNLTVFRIPPKQEDVDDMSKKPVVFLMHGLLGSADDWLLMGPGKSLAYLLSDAGYDVWLGNVRGNKYSRQHVSKHPALKDFWKFGVDQIALHDLPAMINYALITSAQDKLHYVGHSQGTTAFFALGASRPEYNEKIISMHALAPMVFMKNARSPLIRLIAPHSPLEETLNYEIGEGEFKPSKEWVATVGGSMLKTEIGCVNVSSNVNFVIAGVNIDSLTPELTPVILRHVPAGASTRIIKQYGQQVVSEDFRKYDYGPAINKKVYGSFEAPKYDLEKVTAIVTLYYAEEDWLASPADVIKLDETMPAATHSYMVPEKHFSHMDFQFSPKAPELVYKLLMNYMKNIENGQTDNYF